MTMIRDLLLLHRRYGLFEGCLAALLFAATLPGYAADSKDQPERLPPVSERAQRVHAAGMLFDGHNDLPWRLRTEDDLGLKKLDPSLQKLDSGQTDMSPAAGRRRQGSVLVCLYSSAST